MFREFCGSAIQLRVQPLMPEAQAGLGFDR